MRGRCWTISQPRLDPYDAWGSRSPISHETIRYSHEHSGGSRRSSDNISIDIDEDQGGFCSDGDDSQSTASARLPVGTIPPADDARSDSDVSFYEAVDTDLPPAVASDDQVRAINRTSSPILKQACISVDGRGCATSPA
jgi:hypothetical protein